MISVRVPCGLASRSFGLPLVSDLDAATLGPGKDASCLLQRNACQQELFRFSKA